MTREVVTLSEQEQKAPLTIDDKWCKGCNICVSVCPKAVLAKGRKTPLIAKPDECIGCRICEWSCPDYAISVHKKEGGN